MFGRNINREEILAPGETVIDGSTSDATPAAFKLVETGASFLSTLREFDLAIKDPDGSATSSLIREVESDTSVETYDNLDFNAVVYDAIRPSELIVRPGEGGEWAVHGIQAQNVGALTPLILFATDGVRLTKLHTSTDADGFVWINQQFKVSYDRWLKLLYYGPRTLNISIDGINKTVDNLGRG